MIQLRVGFPQYPLLHECRTLYRRGTGNLIVSLAVEAVPGCGIDGSLGSVNVEASICCPSLYSSQKPAMTPAPAVASAGSPAVRATCAKAALGYMHTAAN